MSSNYVSAIISLVRSTNKAVNKGDKVAAFVTVGNAVKVVEKLAKIDNCWGQGAKTIVDTFTTAAETSPMLKALGNGVQLLKKGDEIGMAMSTLQVAKSTSPVRKLIEEGLGWSTKIATKAFMLKKMPKIVQNTKGLSSVANYIEDFSKNTKGMGQIPTIISGIAYSLVTIYGPKYARKLGGWVSDKLGINPYDDKKDIRKSQLVKVA